MKPSSIGSFRVERIEIAMDQFDTFSSMCRDQRYYTKNGHFEKLNPHPGFIRENHFKDRYRL